MDSYRTLEFIAMSDVSQSASPATGASEPKDGSGTAPKSLLETTLLGAIALAQSGKSYDQAAEQFAAVASQVESESSEAATLLKRLWKEYISVQRSAVFYEGLSDAEAGLSEKMAESNIQLKRNYMRLVQEQ